MFCFLFVVGISAQREGLPSEYELEELSQKLGVSWKSLARRLGFHEGEITGFHKDNEEYSSKALQMLFRWKQKRGSDATYGVLYDALCDKLVGRRDLAEVFCCDQRLHRQTPNQPGELYNSLLSTVDLPFLASVIILRYVRRSESINLLFVFVYLSYLK